MKTITEHVQPAAKTVSADDDQLHAKDGKQLRAEKLVAYAESMMSPIGFFYADEVLDEALKVDPNNRQAQFYKAFLAPFMKFRGFLTRVGNGAHLGAQVATAGFTHEYAFATGGLRDFLNEPAPPFRNEADFQAFVADLMVEQTKLINFAKKNRHFLTHFSFPVFSYTEMLRSCFVERQDKGRYLVPPCPYLAQFNAHMNEADWEALLQMWTGMKIMMMIATSYDLDGYFEFLPREILGDFRSDKASFDFLNRLGPRIGTLYPGHKLHDILGMASDLYGGLRWLMSIQDQMCDPEKRETNLFQFHFVCIKPTQKFRQKSRISVDNALRLLEMSLSGMGGSVQIIGPLRGAVSEQPITSANIDILALIKNPPRDLKALFPNRYDRCGRARGLLDLTFGGMFPNGNAPDLLLHPPLQP